ncbi:Shikimate kinase [Usitatibacter rugosus]|uniref:Shikimate kinase n=2 Tax=Usitatibacter rugosus TaxID=2732067 RepID=A0A6M4GNT2_9PROT|nr:Shikimate kinase [Usitatibacter rugosus]
MMGAGKTTIGRALARKLGLVFADADKELVTRTGVAVATIFEIEGEAGFRKRESTLLVELAAGENAVIATGGGVVLDPENRKVMRERGTVVYLRARLESLWERTRHDTSRPLLATPDPKATLATLLEQREPLYMECAHLVVDTGPQSPSALATRLAATLRQHAGSA